MTTMLVSNELGCVYRLTPHGLEWTPLSKNGLFDFEAEGGEVEPENVGEEIVTFEGKEQTLNEVYKTVTEMLS